jgi:hypothetical protein
MCEAIRDFNNLNLIQKDQLGHAEWSEMKSFNNSR